MSAGASASVPAADAALLLRVLSTAAAREARTHARSAPWGSKLAVWRGQVVAWMRDLAAEFKFDPETVAIAVSFFDRVLSAIQIPSKVFQTAALACMYIAAKVHERFPMTTQDLHAFAAICTADAVKEAEVIVLYHLGWDTTAFPPISFVRTALQLVPNAAVSTTVGGIAEVLADLVMLDYELTATFRPSSLGMACLVVASRVCGFDGTTLADGLICNGVALEALNDALLLRVTHLHETWAAQQHALAAAAAAAVAQAAAAAAAEADAMHPTYEEGGSGRGSGSAHSALSPGSAGASPINCGAGPFAAAFSSSPSEGGTGVGGEGGASCAALLDESMETIETGKAVAAVHDSSSRGSEGAPGPCSSMDDSAELLYRIHDGVVKARACSGNSGGSLSDGSSLGLPPAGSR